MGFLRVAERWQFDNCKQLAIAMLMEHGDPAENIEFARSSGVEGAQVFLVPAFRKLAERLRAPSERVGLLLGARDLLILWHLVDQKLERRSAKKSRLPMEDLSWGSSDARLAEHLLLEGGKLGTQPLNEKSTSESETE